MLLEYLLDEPREDREHEGAEERRDETGDGKARHQPLHSVEEECVEDEREQSERHYRDREREDREHRAHDHREHRPHERDEEDRGPSTAYGDARDEIDGKKDGSYGASET